MTRSAPLAGLKVLEIGHSIAGPYAGMILAELGADVVKLEQPEQGDYARGWGRPVPGGAAIAFETVNRGKRGIAVDLSDSASARAVRRLIERDIDIVVQNLKAGSLDRLGLGADALMADKPSLIWCNMGAFGTTGPLRGGLGYDPLIQAASGLMSVLGGPDSPPLRVPVSLIDMTTGLWAAIGILAAVHARNGTGRGALVDTSLYETGLALMAAPIANYLVSGEVPEKTGSHHPTIAPSGAFRAADGWIMIAVGNDAQFSRFADVLGLSALSGDPRFARNNGRVANRDALTALIDGQLAGAPIDEWAARLGRAGVPNNPILTVDAVAAHAQTQALGMLQLSPDGALRLPGLPVTFDGERPAFARRAPRLGEHNHSVLGDL
ncbi:MAG TPA: CoA transferase [Rhizomicrobium sp.]